jgi:hypothetical protein
MNGKEKTKNRAARLVEAMLFIFAFVVTASPALSEEGAQFSFVEGTVLVRTAGELLWDKAATGTDLKNGSLVKTTGSSIAIIRFTDDSYVRVLPMSTVIIEKHHSENGMVTTIVSFEQGKAWAKMDFSAENEQFVLESGNVFIRGKTASAFIETDGHDNTCFELAKGVATVRSPASPGIEKTIVKNQRILIREGADIGDTENSDDITDENGAADHSCLPRSGKETPEVVTQGSTTTENAIDSLVSSDEPEHEEEQAVKTEEPGGEEYIEVTMTVTTTANFSVSAEAPSTQTVPAESTDTSCEEYPVISNVTVSDDEVEDTGTVALESELPCDFRATATIKWSAYSECGTVKSVTIRESDKAPVFFPGASSGETVNSTYEFLIRDYKQKEMIIKAAGGNGKDTLYSFTIKPQGQSSAALPEISGVTVNGIGADDGSTIRVESKECGPMPVDIKGSAGSECGDIENISVTLDSSDMPVKGRDSWSVKQSFNEDETFMVAIEARDSSGRTSAGFEFEVELVRTVALPEVELQTIGGKEPSPFGGPLELFRNDLVDGNLEVTGRAISEYCEITKVEASTDDSTSWFGAEGTKTWAYRFKPSDGTYEVSAHAFDSSGNESEEMDSFEIIYSKYTLEEKLLMTFNDMMQAYRDKDSDTFMAFTSPNFSSPYDSIEDYNRMETALSDKFSEQTTVYIRYQETSHSVSGETGRVTFSWDANPASSGYSHKATFVFTKTTEGWKFTAVQDNDTFLRHTNIAAYLTASSDRNTLYADGQDTAIISAVARDSAYDPVKDGTAVNFQASSGWIDASATTEEGIAELEYTSGAYEGFVTVGVSSGSISDTVTIRTIPLPPPGPPGDE